MVNPAKTLREMLAGPLISKSDTCLGWGGGVQNFVISEINDQSR